ncbi:HEAT repeat domain-containing protein [Sphingomonas sp. RIT328]|uniref:HEAT repeat domain-containing protein n=1 Tax=Sphingomonas sp. RIT328 TaxID=1470591 RepID=UPI0004527876|nr:HEAT repeat domain-containing protein [Sphingomonas sp. RIT328]EZP48652.1 HEAT repeat domain protein [Sphingomonas sp. RIT328]
MPLVKVPANDPQTVVDDAAAGSLAHLVALLAAPGGADRRAAVRGLEAHDEGIAPLCARLAIETAASVREAIVATLIRRRSTAVVTALLPLLRSDEAPQRNAALEALAAMPDEVAPHVEPLLRDADPDVRIFTANLLGVLPHPQAEAWLLTALADDHVNVCAAAIDGLAEIGSAAALPALRALPARFPDDSFIAFAAAVAAQRIDA